MNAAAYRSWGIAFAVAGTLAFSFRPILIKLSYAAYPVTPTTLLFLRMTLSLPFFIAVAWWLRGQEPRLAPRARPVRQLAQDDHAQEDEPDDEHAEDDVRPLTGGVENHGASLTKSGSTTTLGGRDDNR